ncbi:MAG TPA: hypothetical protein VGR57_05040 [Ktedonobacterales bacterium]|nr:hypothetical protein [Ktedonobacterales bacterium]
MNDPADMPPAAAAMPGAQPQAHATPPVVPDAAAWPGAGPAERAAQTPRPNVRPGPTSGPNHSSAPLALPPRPGSLAETKLDPILLEELALKIVAHVGSMTGGALAERMMLPLAGVVEHLIATLRRDSFVESVSGGAALVGAAGMILRVTDRGTQRAHVFNQRSEYAGPAPVPLVDLEYALRQQAPARRFVGRDNLRRRLGYLVLPDETMDAVGAGVESGGPLLLYGPPGNGKTAVGAAIARALGGGGVLVPYAVEVDGQIVRVFDPSVHRPIAADQLPTARFDDRWVLCHAPFVRAGGELRLDQLDFIWNERQRFYDAPIQLKAAGGVLLMDDFGQQQHRPEFILNRWVVPLETGMDYLTLINGSQVPLPFTPLLIFATNLEPAELMHEAYLRRIPCKVYIGDPSEQAFHEICRRQCQELGIEFSEQGLAYLIERCYTRTGQSWRASHPRDLLRLVASSARYFGVAPQLTPRLIDVAANLYFV